MPRRARRAGAARAARAHRQSGADVIHGHSSRHLRAIEVYRGKPVFYGCGDFLDDYEGIPGHAPYRPDLTLMYFPVLDAATGLLGGPEAVPMRIRHVRLAHALDEDVAWLRETLAQQGERFGVRVERIERAEGEENVLGAGKSERQPLQWALEGASVAASATRLKPPGGCAGTGRTAPRAAGCRRESGIDRTSARS
ncbi:CapA family protein [Paraburkholderia kururiensis]|uniref:CapA family protein n=1 Tax=Paraburkholderia kururiensis TaxID=984307 RepID=A0ABZ0WJT6_9BURK|nr:CapA family protein [Paraburkholderia kururiensis]WQD77586.1 CapA family protein [Paraburkholderia kururiensis]